MNVNDYKAEDLGITGEDRLDQIFRRQLELMQKYHDIERSNGLLITEDVPVNLHDAKGQFRLKDFAWRITEELGEALEAFIMDADDLTHYREELIDGLHFLTEFTILSGMSPEDLSTSDRVGDKLDHFYRLKPVLVKKVYPLYGTIAIDMAVVIMSIATACNCLKNKPWKRSQMLTDELYFKSRILIAWKEYINLFVDSGMHADDVIELYFKKSEVNRFRQRSNY